MDDAVRAYIDDVDPALKPLFDRVYQLIRRARPKADLSISYGILRFSVDRSRLFLGVWRHGVSLYGWNQDDDGGILARHPHLKHGKATLRLRPKDAEEVQDQEIIDLVRAALRVQPRPPS